MINVCLSGGAEGADKLFGEEAAKAGHNVFHWSFQNHKSSCDPNTIYLLNEMHLSEANEPLKQANKLLKRAFPTRSWYVNNLLKRNFFQIKDTERIYAVTPLNEQTGLPEGGTGWAVTMGIQRGVSEVYVYDWKTDIWNKFVRQEGEHFIWEEIDKPPRPHGRYTGIGSHDLPANGAVAIKQLYE